MNQFSIGGAWSKGFGFFSGSGARHALVLIGIGIVTPLVLQVLITGGPMGMTNPATLGQAAARGFLAPMGVALIVLVGLGSYALQIGSYFASWRLGFDSGETAGGAIVFGLITGAIVLVMIVALIALIAVAAAAVGAGSGEAATVVIVLLLCIPLLLLFAALYTAIASGILVITLFMLLIVVAAGSSTARFNPLLGEGGGGAAVLLVIFLLMLLLFWVAARLSCTTAIMASRRTFSLFTGIAESWRVTSSAQWRILGLLVLVGLVVCAGFLVLGIVAGVSMAASFQPGGPPPRFETAQIVASLVAGIPFAYLTVLVPAGIYRELAPFVPEHEVFA